MPTYSYSVLQYVPDPVRNERINVGVLVVGEDEAFFSARLVGRSERGRLTRLGFADDFAFLEHVQQQFAMVTQAQIPGTTISDWTPDRLREISRGWGGTLQVTMPRAVVHQKAPATLAADLYGRFVADPAPKRKRARDRRAVTQRVRNGLRAAVHDLQPELDVKYHIHNSPKVQGRYGEHTFDLMIRNGHPLEVVRSLSVEADSKRVRLEIDAIAWAVDDLRQANAELPVSVVSFGDDGKLLASAERLYSDLGATFVREPAIDEWIAESAERVVLEAAAEASQA